MLNWKPNDIEGIKMQVAKGKGGRTYYVGKCKEALSGWWLRAQTADNGRAYEVYIGDEETAKEVARTMEDFACELICVAREKLGELR